MSPHEGGQELCQTTSSLPVISSLTCTLGFKKQEHNQEHAYYFVFFRDISDIFLLLSLPLSPGLFSNKP